MTRATLRRNLRRTTFWLLLILIVALAGKLAEIGVIGNGEKPLTEYGKAVYEFIKDMAVVIVTIAAAWLAAVLQRRSKFIESLEEEWRRIVQTKSALFAYCEREKPTYDDYVEAFRRISDTVDMLRIVYRNVGETESKIGLHPYVPLQDMRRAFQTLDPSKRDGGIVPADERKRARDAIIQCWNALRETFLEELDLEEPARPILVWGAVRSKQPGATAEAERRQKHQSDRRDEQIKSGSQGRSVEIDQLLKHVWEREHRK